MSQENVEVVRRVIDGRRIDVTEPEVPEAFVGRLDPEIEFEEDPSFPEAGLYHGRSEVLRYFKNFTASFEQFVFEVEDMKVAGGDGVLVCFRQSGRGEGSGAEFDFQSAWLFTVRDDRVLRIRSYLDQTEALEAAGLSEKAMSQKNVEVIRRAYEAFNRGDFDEATSLPCSAQN